MPPKRSNAGSVRRAEAYLRGAAKRADRALARYAEQLAKRSVPRLAESMRYSLELPGKRFRPALMFAACEAVGGDPTDTEPFAAAIEMIHTYSLVHDDLPCMDDAPLRRGKPSSHTVYGEAGAVLAGDGLLTDAFAVAATGESAVSDARRVRIVAELARAAGSEGMVAGQVLDLEAEGQALGLDGLRDLHARKTGAMILASVRIGALAGRAGPRQTARLDDYGRSVGLAFQVVDDILDVVGDEKALGKQVGGDAHHEKSTYPALLGLEAAREMAEDLRARAIRVLDPLGAAADPLRRLADLVVDRRS